MVISMKEKLTPMMQQYLSVKEKYKDALLFFRVGDFYELFFEDAIKASAILNITLTSRDKSDKDAIPLCGVPYHSIENYISKLIQEGYKAVLCDQVEDPRFAKGIVKREVVRVITPGTITDMEILDPRQNNYIAGLVLGEYECGVAFADVSCGHVRYFKTENIMKDVFERLNLKEIVILEEQRERFFKLIKNEPCPISIINEKIFDNFNDTSLEKKALKILQYYTKNVVLINAINFDDAKSFHLRDFMFIDENSKRDLEITEPLLKNASSFSLLSAMDNTITPMGGRLLRQYINFPLVDCETINERLYVVENIVNNSYLLDTIRNILKKISDLERLVTNLNSNNPNPRYLIALANSLKQIPLIQGVINKIGDIRNFFELKEFNEIINLIEKSIIENCPINAREGGVIKNGYSAELDELRSIVDGGAKFLVDYEKKEREKTGISSLKVRYNKVFGYFIEVTKANLSNVPSHYMRKQTLVNAERFITEELKSLEEKVLTAFEKARQLEFSLLINIVKEIQKYTEEIKKVAHNLAKLDVLSNFAFNAIKYNYTKPKIYKKGDIKIIDGRHPFVELSMQDFVPNDTEMSKSSNIMLITGPNMAGKSTYMRQVALIVIMSHMGSYVPAKTAELPIIDQIFTRIGTSDFLASGKSTFMVEMLETARILNEATESSLVVLDEVGRGTSTYDGMAIAWAVLEFLSKNTKRPYVFFSTHYHELTELALTFENIKNYNVTVREWQDDIIFLHKVKEGVANRSYGIHVAKLAGLPEEVIIRAKEILEKLEMGTLKEDKMNLRRGKVTQLSLFTALENKIMDEIKKVDMNRLTPLEAFDLLRKLKSMAED